MVMSGSPGGGGEDPTKVDTHVGKRRSQKAAITVAGDIGDAWPALGREHLAEPVLEIACGVEGPVDDGDIQGRGQAFEEGARAPAVDEIFTPVAFKDEEVCVFLAAAH